VNLRGRVVVVADADLIRGQELACALAEAGAHIVVSGRDADALGRLASEVRATHPVRVAVFVGDVTAVDARRALAEMVGELFPELGAKT
jgi:short-subunit dehydrogenase